MSTSSPMPAISNRWPSIAESPDYRFVQGRHLRPGSASPRSSRAEEIDAVMHLAAESHVDRSIDAPGGLRRDQRRRHIQLLDAALDYWRGLDRPSAGRFRFHHISTDEVFGDLPFDDGLFTEETPYAPSSPYSASKAASDHLVRAWHQTYGLPVVLSNCSNNYGPYHFPEKLIPLVILNALEGKPLPVYGEGENVRDWLYVEDHARALETILAHGRVGESYNVGARSERTNLEVVEAICDLVDRRRPGRSGSYRDLIASSPTAPGMTGATPSMPPRSSASWAGGRPRASRAGSRKRWTGSSPTNAGGGRSATGLIAANGWAGPGEGPGNWKEWSTRPRPRK